MSRDQIGDNRVSKATKVNEKVRRRDPSTWDLKSTTLRTDVQIDTNEIIESGIVLGKKNIRDEPKEKSRTLN